MNRFLFFTLGWTALNGFWDTVPVLLAALLHECGHLLACFLLGVPIRAFSPLAAGAVIGYDAISLSYPQEMAAAAAGPLVNLLSFFLMLPCRGRFAALFGMASLALALFNLLPHRRLDGGVILSACFSALMGADFSARVVHILSVGITVLLWMSAAAVQLRCGGNLSLLFVSVYFLMTM